MKFYTSIADLYDNIFPYKPQQKAFIEALDLHGEDQSILDVGCGTGSLVLELSKLYGTVIGMEPEKEMLDKANFKAMQFKADHRDDLEYLGKWVFLPKGMGDLRTEFAPDSFDTVLCIGNTLVHLSDKNEVQQFLSDAYSILKPGGKLIIQIINYDRIIDQNLKGLPTIETDVVKFERYYHYDNDPSHVEFHTILTVKATNEVIENRIPLLALRTVDMRIFLESIGFEDVEEFGNFKKEAFGMNSQPYIVVAGKN